MERVLYSLVKEKQRLEEENAILKRVILNNDLLDEYIKELLFNRFI